MCVLPKRMYVFQSSASIPSCWIATDGTEESLHSPSLGLKLTLLHPYICLQCSQQLTTDSLCNVLNSLCKRDAHTCYTCYHNTLILTQECTHNSTLLLQHRHSFWIGYFQIVYELVILVFVTLVHAVITIISKCTEMNHNFTFHIAMIMLI